MSKFAQKTLKEIYGYLRDVFYSEELARRKGFLQNRDSRIKIISLIMIVLAISLSQNLSFILSLSPILIFLLIISHIPLGYFFKRIFFAIFIFSLFFSIPYMFNIFQPDDGTPLLILIDFGKPVKLPFLRPVMHISITKEGLDWCLLLLARINLAGSFTSLLIVSTKWKDLLSGLHDMKVPSIVIVIIGMTYRYIFLLLDTIIQMLDARKSRSLGKEGFVRAWKLNSSLVGAIFLRSHDLSNNVYQAMVSRGFFNEFKIYSAKSREPRGFREISADAFLLVLSIITLIGVFFI